MHCLFMFVTIINILGMSCSVPTIFLVVNATIYLLLGGVRVHPRCRSPQYDITPNLAVLRILYSFLVFRCSMEYAVQVLWKPPYASI